MDTMNYLKDDECCVSLGKEHTRGIRPKISHGGFGLIKEDEEYIIFQEDDGHFWDVLEISSEQLEHLKLGIIELKNNVSSKKGDLFKFRFKEGIPKIKSKHFNIHYDFENYFITRIKLTMNGKDIEFHPYEIDTLVRCLRLVEHY